MAIAVPELLYQMVSIYNDYSTAMNASMVLLFVVYISLVGFLVFGMYRWERAISIPGSGG
jgi:polar amino acid transport system permease protein